MMGKNYLIVGIVIVIIGAIIFFTIPSCDDCGKGNLIEAKEAIGNAISTGKGGDIFTQPFVLEAGDVIASNEFENNGFDSREILFGKGDFKDMKNFEVGIESANELSYVNYSGVTPRQIKAQVYCHATGSRLKGVLEALEETVPEGLCLLDDSITPCCAVILRRAR